MEHYFIKLYFADIFPKYLTNDMKSMTRAFFSSFQELEEELEKEEQKQMS